VLALVLAGSAGTALSDQGTSGRAAPARPAPSAVLAGADADPAAIAAAARELTRPGRPAPEIVRAGGSLEAQAESAALAAGGYDSVVGVGPQARGAIAQARAAEIGDGTRWRPVP